MIWRDDDISCFTNLDVFMRVHDIFIKYNVRHTIAVVAKDIETAPALIDYIKQNNFDVQIHCWEHVDLTEHHDAFADYLFKSVNAIEKYFGTSPSTLYPPWNKTDDVINEAAKILNIKISAEKLSLAAYIRAGGGVKEKVVNFHYWADQEVMLLEIALRIFKQTKYRCK